MTSDILIDMRNHFEYATSVSNRKIYRNNLIGISYYENLIKDVLLREMYTNLPASESESGKKCFEVVESLDCYESPRGQPSSQKMHFEKNMLCKLQLPCN